MPKQITTPGDYRVGPIAHRLGTPGVIHYNDGATVEAITYYDDLEAARELADENEDIMLQPGDKKDGFVNLLRDNPFTPDQKPETFASTASAPNSIAWYYDAVEPLTVIDGQQYSNAGVEYIAVQTHKANAPNFAPGPATAALFKVLRLPYELWVQPLGAHDIYDEGDLVTWDAGAGVQNWRCNVEAGSSFAPGVFGWEVV